MNLYSASMSMKIIVAFVAGLLMSQSCAAKPQQSWLMNKPTLLQWYGIGFAAKLIINYVTESLELEHQQLLDTKFEHNIAGLSEQQLQARRLQDHTTMDEFKARMEVAEKIVETTLQKSTATLYSSLGAPSDFISSVTNAYEAGEKWLLFSKVAKSFPLLELVNQRVHDATARYFFELTPIKSTHTTALYCGPKDPYCLYDIQPSLTFADALQDTLNTNIAPLLTVIMNVAAGVIFSNIGYQLGSTATMATSALSQNSTATMATSALSQKIMALGQEFGMNLLVHPLFANLFQKGMERYIEVKTINELKRLLMDLVEDIDLSKERIAAEKRIKWGSQAKIIEAQTIPTYQKFLNDLQSA